MEGWRDGAAAATAAGAAATFGEAETHLVCKRHKMSIEGRRAVYARRAPRAATKRRIRYTPISETRPPKNTVRCLTSGETFTGGG